MTNLSHKVPPFPDNLHRRTQTVVDYCTYEGANRLAHAVRSHWAELGIKVTVSIVPIRMQDKSDSKGFAVRSNLVGGGPWISPEVYNPKDVLPKKRQRAVQAEKVIPGDEYV